MTDSTNDLNDSEVKRNSHVDYNASCEWVWGTTEARSLFGMLDVVLQHHVCHLNVWKKGTWREKSKCKWINWESKEGLCGISNKNIIQCIFELWSLDERDFVSNQLTVDSFMCGAWHFSASELKLLRHRNLIDNIVRVFCDLPCWDVGMAVFCNFCKGAVSSQPAIRI